MKKVLKVLGIVLGVIVLLAGAFALYVNQTGIPSYPTNPPDLKVEIDSTRIAKGAKIASMLCAECHRGENSNVLEGKKMLDLPLAFGESWIPNITQHPEKGIGKYTDGELAFLLRTGIKRDGQYTPPWMLKFPHLADEDLYSIIAFLRSDDPTVQPSSKEQPAGKPSFLMKFLSHVAFKPLPYPDKKIEAPSPNNQVAYGKYLANGVFQCYGCHAADFKTVNELEPEKSPGFYGGGNVLVDLDMKEILSSNITKDKETGIGKWTKEQFVKAVKWGVRPDGTPILYPMLKYTQMEDWEVQAIWEYLQTVEPISNKVKRKTTSM